MTATAAASAVLSRLAERTSAIGQADITEQGRRLIRVALADTIGVALAGSDFEGVRIARSIATSHGLSLILGSAERVGALDAGLLNGMAAHALDYDDSNIVMAGHPSAVLVPAILAMAEHLDSDAAELITAYAAGFEAISSLSRRANPALYEKGWHPTSVIGVFGAAAAAARLLRLNGEQTAAALAVCASQAAGIKANFGTMTKSLHIGQAVRNGLAGAFLAAGGFTANPGAVEAAQGFLAVYNGPAVTPGPDDDQAGLAVNTGLNVIKAYPCCHSTHAAVEAAIRLRRDHGLHMDDISAIRVVVDARRMPHTDRPVLTEALAGKFSLQYVVARALRDGHVGLEHFEGDAHRDSGISELMRRVQVTAALPGQLRHPFAARVTVTSAAGDTFEAVRDPGTKDIPGRADETALWLKFADCAGRVLPGEQVDALARALRAGPSGSVRELLRLCETADG